MQNKIIKYLILICAMGGIVLHGIGWSEMHAARALSQITGKKPVMVQVTSSEEVIQLEYNVPEATFTSLGEESPCPQGTCTKTRMSVGNALYVSVEGKPLLPIIPSIIMVPAGKTIDNIEVTRSGEIEHEDEYFLEFGERVSSCSCTTNCDERAEPDSSIYYSDNPFPVVTYNLVTTQKKCGVSIVYINIYPVTYYPLSQRVVSYSSISLSVNLTETTGQSDYAIACYPERVHPERMDIENPGALESYTPEYCQQVRDGLPTGGICDPAEIYKYVVITNEVFKDYTHPDDPTLSNLITWREEEYLLTAKVVTVEEIYANSDYDHGDHDLTEPAEDNEVKVRNFIIDAHNDWKTEYVLIIGTPYSNPPIPMRKLSAYHMVDKVFKGVYSDLYYQCLETPYNSDETNPWGEKTDGIDGKDVDLTADVDIGRVYAETEPIEMSYFIDKTIKFETDVSNDIPYTRNSLMIGQDISEINWPAFYASNWLEQIHIGSFYANYRTYGFNSSYYMLPFAETMYEADGEWSTNDIKGKFNIENYGIMNHMGHGATNQFMKLVVKPNLNDIDDLTNDKFPFIYSQACDAGHPAGIGRFITAHSDNGAWGAVMNTNESFFWTSLSGKDCPSNKFNRQFWDAYFFEGLFNVGAMNADSHEDNIKFMDDLNSIRFTIYETTLIGDPYTFFKDPLPCERNFDQLTIFLGYQDILARKLITTSADVTINDGANVTFASGEEIRLLPGFNANYGSKFSAFIDPILYKADCD